MNVIILGATGMLGHTACRVLSRDFTVAATRRPASDHGDRSGDLDGYRVFPVDVDADGLEQVRRALGEFRPDVALNCIGIVKQKEEARDAIRTIRVNALFPHELAAVCDHHGAKLIQISTDCVFSGSQGMYRETDPPDPVDLYGRSKWLGEVVQPPHLTIRTSMIGRELRGHTGLFEWFRSQRGRRVRGYRRAVFSGLTTEALSRVIADVLKTRPELTGLYHVAAEPISKFDLLQRLNERLALDVDIQPDDEVRCDRSLDGSRFLRDAAVTVPSWDVMIERLAQNVDTYEDARS